MQQLGRGGALGEGVGVGTQTESCTMPAFSVQTAYVPARLIVSGVGHTHIEAGGCILHLCYFSGVLSRSASRHRTPSRLPPMPFLSPLITSASRPHCGSSTDLNPRSGLCELDPRNVSNRACSQPFRRSPPPRDTIFRTSNQRFLPYPFQFTDPITITGPSLWSSSQSFWLLTQWSRVPPALPHSLSSNGSGTGSTQPL
jgi:hypothetical protein